MTRLIAAGLVAGLSAVLLGCGGGSEEKALPPPPPGSPSASKVFDKKEAPPGKGKAGGN